MLTTLVEALEDENVGVRALDPPPGLDAHLELTLDGRVRYLAVARRARSPYPGELEQLIDRRDQLGQWGTPTLSAPFISESVGRLLVPLGWSWVDDAGNCDVRIQGLRVSHRRTGRPTAAAKKGIPQGSGGLAIIRFLVGQPDAFHRTGRLAALAGITHARASQVLHRLRHMRLVTKDGRGWRADRERLLDRFVEEYRGPGGSEVRLYTVDPPLDTLGSLLATVPGQSGHIAVSADLGPDLLAPWRRPTVSVVYVAAPARLNIQGLAAAPDRQAANVLVRYPADTSVFHPPALGSTSAGVPLADPLQMIWDLYDLGGEDRADAAAHLTQWVLNRR